MTLDILKAEMIGAVLEHDKTKKTTLSSLIGNIEKAAIAKKQKDAIPEETVNEVLIKEQKTYEEMIAGCPSERTDLLELYQRQFNIIKAYAPVIETDETAIAQIISSIGIDIIPQNRGQIMKALKGKADMKVAAVVLGNMLKEKK